MNAGGMSEWTAFNHAARRAKGVLWLAVGVFVVSQFLIINSYAFGRGWWFLMIGDGFRVIISDWANSEYFVVIAMVEVLLIVFLLSLLAAPWLVDFLTKAPPILWMLRLVISVPAAIAVWVYVWDGVVGSIEPPAFGIFLGLLAVVMNAIGLWMIPKMR
jgi:hypothetical protein